VLRRPLESTDDLIVKFARGIDLAREQRGMTTSLKHLEVLAAGLMVYAKKGANRAATQPTVVRQNHHGPVAVGQASLVEVVNQDRKIRDIADLAPQLLRPDLLLEDSPHPFERNLLSLLSRIGVRGAPSYPSRIAEELLRALGGDNRRISTGQQEEKVDCVLLLLRDQ